MKHQSSKSRRPFLGIRSRAPVLVAIGVTLLALALAIGQTIVSQREARVVGRASSDALLATHEVLEAMLDAETGQRGYLLTREESYLEPYAHAREELDLSLRKLSKLLRRNPSSADAHSMQRLTLLINDKVKELDRTVSLARAGRFDEALAIVRQDVGKRQMDAIRAEAERLMDQKRSSRAVSVARITRFENSLLPLVAVLGLLMLGLIVLALLTEQKRASAVAEAEQADALRTANERAGLLARELNHRVKNLFSVILSIVSLSARGNAPRDEMIEDVRARIRALALAHSATQGGDGNEAVDLRTTISATLQPYVVQGADRVKIDGPPVDVPVRMVTPIGLIMHELATNAAKYGAFSADGGTVGVSWELLPDPEGDRLVRLRWEEQGGPAPQVGEGGPDTTGFGTRMTALAVSQLGGTLDRRWPASGAIAQFEFPVS